MNNIIFDNFFIKTVSIIIVKEGKFLRNFRKSDFLLMILFLTWFLLTIDIDFISIIISILIRNIKD